MNDLYVIQIPRREVESKDIGTIIHYIQQLEKIKAPSQCIEILFDGYDDSTDEVFEIPDIRKWVYKVLKQTPEVLYYTSTMLGTTLRLLACSYDVETVSEKRMNAYEAYEYAVDKGHPQHQPVLVKIPVKECERLIEGIKMYGLKRKDVIGSKIVINYLNEVFSQYK